MSNYTMSCISSRATANLHQTARLHRVLIIREKAEAQIPTKGIRIERKKRRTKNKDRKQMKAINFLATMYTYIVYICAVINRQ